MRAEWAQGEKQWKWRGLRPHTVPAYSGIAESALATGASMIFGPNHPGRWRHRAGSDEATRLLLVQGVAGLNAAH